MEGLRVCLCSGSRLLANTVFDGIEPARVLGWYRLTQQGRLLEDRASMYIRKAQGWGYYASFAGHDAIQCILGQAFRPNKDYLFSYYRDLLTVLAAGMTPYEIVLNGLSKEADLASGGRHMSNHFAKTEVGIQNVS